MLGDGTQLRFSHQLVQEYFAAVELRAKLQAAIQQGKWPLVGGMVQTLRLRQFARPGVRTGWEETLLLLAGLDGEGSLAHTLIRIFLDDPLRAARLALASDQALAPELQVEVTNALERIYQDTDLPSERRIEAGSLYSTLAYSWLPVTLSEWQRELAQCNQRFGVPDGYFCYISAGTYRIGGWDEGEPAADHSLPAFWIARLPITVAQFARFVAEGYRDDGYWATNGLKWRGERTAPHKWGDPAYSAANQPVAFVTWYEATAFCAWLNHQLADSLPPDYILRLPSEAEWETAAAFAGPEELRVYPWGDDAPTPEHAVYDAWHINAPAPVGLCPTGMAACGALDLAGNVYEWTSSSYKAYPDGAATLAKDFTDNDGDVPLRGCAFWSDRTLVRCGARVWNHPFVRNNYLGLRVVVAPRARTNVLFSAS